MLSRFTVKNFGCLRDVSVALAPFTVLVGPNDSGKSMILKALQSLALSVKAKEGWRSCLGDEAGFLRVTFNQNGAPIELQIEGEVGADPISYSVAVQGKPGLRVMAEALLVDDVTIGSRDDGMTLVVGNHLGTVPLGPQRQFLHAGPPSILDSFGRDEEEPRRLLSDSVVPVISAIARMRRHQLRPERLLDSVGLPTELQRPMASEGLGLATVLADLLLENPGTFNEIQRALTESMPHVASLHVKRVGSAGAKSRAQHQGFELELGTSAGARIPADLASDGVLLFLAYLVLLRWSEPPWIWPEPPWVLMFEEPETALHPGLMERLVRLFRGASRGEHGGKPVQILVSTQSPDFLNFVEPEEIRVVRRQPDGATQVTRFEDAPDLKRLLEYQGPGEVWVNLGEEYLAGQRGDR